MKRLIILPLLLLSLTLGATKYYVDESGNDGTGDGSSGNPWALVSYAATQATTAGDTIYVNAGTINESARINLARGVHLLGDSTDIPKIISTYRDASYYAVWLADETVQDGNQSISYLHFDGSNYTAYGAIMISRRNNVDIHHCTISYFEFWGARFYVNNDVGAVSPTRASGNKFRHNTVINCAGYGANGYGGCGMDGQEDFYIGYNDFIQKNTAGLNGMPIKCVNGNIKNGKIVYNNIYQNPFTSEEHWDFSIEIWDIRGGVEIAYNYLEGSIDLGGKINVKGEYDYCAWVHHNVMGQPTQSLYDHTRGFILEAHLNNEDIIIEKNYVKNTATGLQFGQPEPSEATVFKNIRISHNIFESMGITDALATHSKGWGIKSSDPADWQTVDNWEVYNNVITAKEGTYSTMWGIMIPPMVSTNIKIRNNIVVGFDYAGVFGYNDGDPDITCDYLWIENNCLYNNGNNNVPRYGPDYSPTHNTTQNNITTAPAFKSESTFRLTPTSPCIDAGIDVGLDYDYYGHKITGTPDIGAMEYGRYIMKIK